MPSDAPPTRWSQVRDLLDSARERPEADRETWLRTATEDSDLREEVLSLLRATSAAEDDGFLARSAGETAAGLFAPLAEDADPYVGREVGPWRLTGRLGEGGMGVVYRAERTGADFEQEAALKLVGRGLAPRAIVERFREERRILARLAHPGIARLLDGGMSTDGQPYFAMELVDGAPLTRYAEGRELNVDARLALFLNVCDAVAYAHRNLVVHRDLKPSNILVADDDTHQPTVRLLDFGIAKALTDDEDADLRTQTGAIMTPAYAAPEQVRREPVTTATDVYALGVVLYELLAGTRPYEIGPEAPPTTVEKMVCETDPPPPSAVAPPGVSSRLGGDLDTIVLKALEKEPARRYASAEALAEDLRRHLAGLPVTARRATVGYRVRSFVRRHPVGVGLTVLAVLALVAGLAGTTWQARVASAERDRAQTEAAKAEEIRDYVLGLFSAVNPDSARGREVTVREALEAGAVRLAGELADQPVVRSDMELTIALLYRRLADYGRARAHVDSAIALRERHLGPRDVQTATARRELAQLLIDTGDYDESREAAERAHADHLAALGPDHPETLQSLTVVGATLAVLGEWTEAEEAFEELASRSLPTADTLALSEALLNLGSSRLRQQRFEDAEEPFRQSLALRRAHLGRTHSGTATVMNSLAIAVARGRGDLDEAEALMVEALDIRRQLYGEAHPEIAQMLNSLARLYEEREDFARAEPVYAELLPMMEATLGPEHPYTGLVLVNYGNLLRMRGRPAEGEPFLRRGLSIERAAHGTDHPLAAESEVRLADLLAAMGRDREARRLVDHAQPILEEAYGPDAGPVLGAREIRAALAN
ncbi:MAG: serine/threonine-protein kinase [Bacteroidota bacterium]